MKSMLGVLLRIPLYQSFRYFGWPRMRPINLTLSPSPRCNSQCLTCRIWRKRENELTLSEWERILRSVGKAAYWVTISGGEPFIFRGLVELCRMVSEYCRPGIINIPTNALLFNTIPEQVRQIAESCPDCHLVINLSLDGIGGDHDRIRGVIGNFEKFEMSLQALLELRDHLPNLTLGIHTVISSFNIGHLEEITEYALASGVDQFITEIAESRVELDTLDLPIAPDREAYSSAIERLIAQTEKRDFRGIAKLTQALRVEYYRLTKRILLEETQVIPCYAGWASAQIYADGTVWPCCVRADDLGNLRDVDYDFGAIWTGDRIKRVRQSVADKECYCPLANAAYTNMLHHVPSIIRVGGRVVFKLG